MNRFRVNLHPLFSYGESVASGGAEVEGDSPEKMASAVLDAKNQELKRQLDALKKNKEEEEKKVVEETGGNLYNLYNNTMNESVASSTEENDKMKEIDNEENVEKQMKQLRKALEKIAKNKGWNLDWTNDTRKCSHAEKNLGTSSVKVFLELLVASKNSNTNKVEEFLNKCRQQNGSLDDATAQQWKDQLGVNSKIKDIKNFHKAYEEYQSRQTNFVHLQGLLGFFFEKGIDSVDALKNELRNTSEKISKSNLRDRKKDNYEEIQVRDKYGNMTWKYKDRDGNIVDRLPKNWKDQGKFDIIKARLEKQTDPTEKMLTLLCDLNLDGEVNTGDLQYRTGSQFLEIYRREKAVNKLRGGDENTTVKNLVAYARKMGLNIGEIKDEGDLYNWMTGENGYENTKKLQQLIQSCPADFDDVLKNGENAGADTLESMMRASHRAETINNMLSGAEGRENIDATQQALNETVKKVVEEGREKIKDLYPDPEQQSNIMKQLTDQLPAALLESATNIQKGMAVGARLPLDQIIRGMSVGFNIGVDQKGNPMFGLFVGGDKTIDLGKSTELSLGANTGCNLFIPCATLSAEISKEIRKGGNPLAGKGIHKISVGGNVGVYGGILSWGVSAGVENKKLKSIIEDAKDIHNQIEENANSWVDIVAKKTKELEAQQKTPEEIYNQTKDVIKAKLIEQFGEVKKGDGEGTLDRAADNILRIMRTLRFEDWSPDGQDYKQEKVRYAGIIADVFTEQWKNTEMIGIADNKRKLSGGKVGIQFFAGFMPTLTAVAKFTRYRNARATESEYAEINRIDRAVNGNGNEVIDRKNKLEVDQQELDSFNNQLRLREPNLLQYVENKLPTGEKLGKIYVPLSAGKFVDIRVSADLEGYVEKGDAGYLFPANGKYRIYNEAGGNQNSAILNIGGEKNLGTDINISDTNRMDKLLGNKILYSGKDFPDDWKENWDKYATNLDMNYTNAAVLNTLNLSEDAQLQNVIREVDSINWKQFSKFLKNKVAANQDFHQQKAGLIESLQELSKKQSQEIGDKLNRIIMFFNDGDSTLAEQQLVIDRIMSIAAHAEVHTKAGLDARIRAREQRGNKFLDLKGPNGQSIFNKIDAISYRKDVVNNLKNYNSEYAPNVFGATAFYNKRAEAEAQGLGLTGLGVTTVLGGYTKKIENPAHIKEAQKRFLGDGVENGTPGVLSNEKSPVERQNLNQMLSNYIKAAGVKFEVDNKSGLLSHENLKSLLKGEEITLSIDNGNGNSINNKEQVKIKLDVDYVFYLMGECANESVGMEFGKLHVLHQEDKLATSEVIVNLATGTNNVKVTEKNMAVGAAVNLGQEGETEENTAAKTTNEGDKSGKLPETRTEFDGNPDNPAGNGGPASDGSSTTSSQGGSLR